jgi:glycosyltransferase involved in cell wall biosynthesis
MQGDLPIPSPADAVPLRPALTASATTATTPLRLTYLCLQGADPGQASHTHVWEIIRGLRAAGIRVRYEGAKNGSSTSRPGPVGRLMRMVAPVLRVIVKLPRTDVLYVRSHFGALPAILAAAALRVPVVQELNGPYDDVFIAWPGARRLSRFLIAAMNLQLRLAGDIVTVTPQLGEWVRPHARRAVITVIPNAANVELFHPGATTDRALPPRYVVFFGALASWQGIATMIAATEHADWPQDVSLVIAGDGALRDDVERAAAHGRVVSLGSCPQQELPGIVSGAMASLVVKDHPAHAASGLSPLKLYESMAAGVPVIVSALPGLEEAVQRFDCGIVVPAADAGAVARAVATLSASPDLRRRLGANARRAAVEEHSWQASSAVTARVVERAVERRRERR